MTTQAITPRLLELKAKMFCHGVRIPDDIWAEITHEHHYRHKRAGLSQGRFFELRDGLVFTVVNAPVREPFVQRSPLALERHNGGYRVIEGDVPLAACKPMPWPKWYARSTSDGVPMAMVVSAHSTASLYTAVYQGGCDYFGDGSECRFCSMKIDNKTEWRKIESIIEVAEAALEENSKAEISFGGGTRLTPDKGVKHDIKAIERFRAEVDMPVCVECAPPDTDDWIAAMADAGISSVLFNIELWGRDDRVRLMPGKSKITRERYLAALACAGKLFGAHQVSSQIIVGLEPVDQTIEAVRAVADAGAIPLPVVFRPLPNTATSDHPPPPVEDVLRVFEATVDALKRAGLDGENTKAGCALCGACSAHR